MRFNLLTRFNLSLFTIFFLIISLFITISYYFLLPQFNVSIAASNGEDEEKRKTLEAELSQYEKQIYEYEATITALKKQGNTLKSEIDKLNAKIAKVNLQIKATNLNLQKLDSEIKKTEVKINDTEKDINFQKKVLSDILQDIYKNENRGLLEVMLLNPRLSDFFGDINNLLAIQDNLRNALEKVVVLRDKLVDAKETLSTERFDVVALKSEQDAQKANIQKTQTDKNNLLKTTKGKESEYQKILTETKKTAAEIRKQIFKLLGGGELDFEEAYRLAEIAEKSTGVRAALIMAVLDRESAMGKNVGQCDYKTAMHPKRDIPTFLELVEELGLIENLKSGVLKVSCANADGAYGGAMGPAQFIPSTWKMYKSKISEITGNEPSSPWRNADAFVATALYLKDAGALSNERNAAAKYYCGARWNRYVCTNVYGKKVVEAANRFQDDIDILGA